jgi:hypothetical protein
LLEAETEMIAAKQIANRWYGKVAGVMSIALMITITSAPSPKATLHGLEDRAVQKLTPVMKRSEVGRQVLAVFVEREKECHRAL